MSFPADNIVADSIEVPMSNCDKVSSKTEKDLKCPLCLDFATNIFAIGTYVLCH